MQQKKEDFQTIWSKIVAKAWLDPAFKERLLDNPHAVLDSHAIQVPAGTQVMIVENTSDTFYLVLPQKPSGELSEEDLAKVAAGMSGFAISSPGI